MYSCIDLKDVQLNAKVGEYAKANDPFGHYLDLKFSIETKHVLIQSDNMKEVYDYDPLVSNIQKLESSRCFKTQEYLVKCILDLCLEEAKIMNLEIFLYKKPIANSSASVGIRLSISSNELGSLRQEKIQT